jgi:hypothetical protein
LLFERRVSVLVDGRCGDLLMTEKQRDGREVDAFGSPEHRIRYLYSILKSARSGLVFVGESRE